MEHGERTPVKPRLAASVVLVRDTAAGTETYLTYRGGESPLGAVAFPGGSLLPSDEELVDWYGPTPIQWSAYLGIDDHQIARQYVFAAIRELFEETGILLAGSDDSSVLENNRGPEWMAAREAVAAEDESFASLLKKRALGVRTDLLKPLSRWLSPDFAHRRFNTQYFGAAQPVNQEASLLTSKGIWGAWKCATHIVQNQDTTALGDETGQELAGGLILSEITVPAVPVTLEKIASSKGCIAYLSHKRPLRTFQPELIEQDGEYMLQVQTNAGTEGGSAQRGR
ncbi:hypothetical protein GCM10009611_18970 [Arthrobacter roseus]|nr:NUDIX hydrolase [Arthrobacter roseus]